MCSDAAEDFTPLANLTKLRNLSLACPKLQTVAPLAQLKQLEVLTLFEGEFGDFATLTSLTKLLVLTVAIADVSDADLTALQQALPDCTIVDINTRFSADRAS